MAEDRPPEIPPGREMTEEEMADLPILDVEEFEKAGVSASGLLFLHRSRGLRVKPRCVLSVDLTPQEAEALLLAHQIKDGAWSDETIDRAEELEDALAQAEDKLRQAVRRRRDDAENGET